MACYIFVYAFHYYTAYTYVEHAEINDYFSFMSVREGFMNAQLSYLRKKFNMMDKICLEFSIAYTNHINVASKLIQKNALHNKPFSKFNSQLNIYIFSMHSILLLLWAPPRAFPQNSMLHNIYCCILALYIYIYIIRIIMM